MFQINDPFSVRNPRDLLETQIQPVSLVNIIVERFKQSIVSGQYKPGQSINESQLAEKMGVSRGTLREAFRILISEGMLEKLPNRSLRVRILSAEKAWEIITLRAELECFAARLVSLKLTKEKINQLQKICQKLDEAASMDDDPTFSHWDFQLHRSIMAFSEHELLFETWLKIGSWILLMFANEAHTKGELLANAVNHRNIVEAIISGDPNKAQDTIKKDLLDQSELWRALQADHNLFSKT